MIGYVRTLGHVFGIDDVLNVFAARVGWRFAKAAFFNGGLDPTSASARRRAWNGFDKQTRSALSDLDPTRRGSMMNNEIKLEAGQALQIPGWESQQALIGYGLGHMENLAGQVRDVQFRKGSVVVLVDSSGLGVAGGITFGQYITIFQPGARSLDDVDPDLIRHEWGHTVQSRLLGPWYLTHVGVPSGIDGMLSGVDGHPRFPVEAWASRLGGTQNQGDYPHRATWDSRFVLLGSWLWW